MQYDQDEPGARFRGTGNRKIGRPQTSHKSHTMDGDVWHSVWKRLENEAAAQSAVRRPVRKPLEPPRDYVVESETRCAP